VELPRAHEESLIVRPASFVQRLDLEAIFPRGQELEVELGAGDGSFLIAWASLHPERNFIGVERLLGRLKKIDKKARRAGLANVRGLRIEISYFTEYLLPRESVSAFHIYFPDPWPKLRHRHHRLINERFADVLAVALKPVGVVYLRTDDLDYFAQMRAVFDANHNFTEVETLEGLARVTTDFERDFNARGIPTNRAAYRRSVTRR
jgi:tRNA (guanine-N7-)-methyltransferase